MKDMFFIKGLPLDAGQSHTFNEKQAWCQEILDELTEDLTETEKSKFESTINVDLEITRKHRGSLGDFILLEGDITIEYPTHCVKTFKMMKETQVTPVNAIVLDNNLEKELELEEETTFFLDTDELDLYFYHHKLDVKPIIHEYVFLNKNPYPRIDANEGIKEEEE